MVSSRRQLQSSKNMGDQQLAASPPNPIPPGGEGTVALDSGATGCCGGKSGKEDGCTAHRRSACLALAATLLAGCASTGQHITEWGQITVGPGDTGTCQSNPCQVFFRMPEGSGTYKVTGNAVTYGIYPAGKTVTLGGFFDSNSIKVPDAGVPPAYVYVPPSF